MSNASAKPQEYQAAEPHSLRNALRTTRSTESKPDTKATADTAASPIDADSEACLAAVRRLPDYGG
jgi:hypothetical protein